MFSLDIIRSEDNKSICDGLGCFSEATTRIEEVVGDSIIALDLCDDCVIKFREQ
jgi:hypothetical protein